MIQRPWTTQEPIQEPEPYNLDLNIERGVFKQDRTPEEWASRAQEAANSQGRSVIYGGNTYAPQVVEPIQEPVEAPEAFVDVGEGRASQMFGDEGEGLRESIFDMLKKESYAVFFGQDLPGLEMDQGIVDMTKQAHKFITTRGISQDKYKEAAISLGVSEESVDKALVHYNNFESRRRLSMPMAEQLSGIERAHGFGELFREFGPDVLAIAKRNALASGDVVSVEIISVAEQRYNQTMALRAISSSGVGGDAALPGVMRSISRDLIGGSPRPSEETMDDYGLLRTMVNAASKLAKEEGVSLEVLTDGMTSAQAARISEEAAKYMDGKVAEGLLKSELDFQFAGGLTVSQALSNMARLLNAYREKFPEKKMDYSELGDVLAEAQVALQEKDGSSLAGLTKAGALSAVGHLVAVVGATARGIGGWVGGREQHRPLAFVFPDGKIYDNWMDATAYSMRLMKEKGAIDAEDPDLMRAQSKYRVDQDIVGGPSQAMALLSGGMMSRGALPGEGVERIPGAIYARPTLLIGRTAEEKSTWEKLGDVAEGFAHSSRDYTMDAMLNNTRAGLYEDSVGHTLLWWDALISDAVFDPINLATTGSLTPVRNATKAMKAAVAGKSAESTMIRTLDKILSGVDIGMISNKRRAYFTNGREMSAPWVAARDSIRKLWGTKKAPSGGVGADEFAEDILTRIAKDPNSVRATGRQLLKENGRALVEQVRRSGLERPPEIKALILDRMGKTEADFAAMTTRQQSDIIGNADRLWAKRVIDETMGEVQRVVDAIPGVHNKVNRGIWKKGVHDIDEILSKDLHTRTRGLFVAGTNFGIPISPVWKKFSEATAEARKIVREAGSPEKLKALEGSWSTMGAPQVRAYYAARKVYDLWDQMRSVWSADIVTAQTGKFAGEQVKIPYRLKKYMEFRLRRRLAASSQEIPAGIGRMLRVKYVNDKGKEAYRQVSVKADEVLGRSEDSLFLHLIESGHGTADEAAEYVIDNWRRINGKYDDVADIADPAEAFKQSPPMTPAQKERIKSMSHGLWDNVEMVRKNLDAVFEDMLRLGLGTDAQYVDSYVQHFFSGPESKHLKGLSSANELAEALRAKSPGALDVSGGYTMKGRTGPVTLAEAKELGYGPLESAVQNLAMHFGIARQITIKESFKAGVASMFGQVGIRGKEALTKMLGHSEDARWAFEERFYDVGLERAMFDADMSQLRRQTAEFAEEFSNFQKVKKLLGMGTARMTRGETMGEALIRSEEFINAAAAKPTNKILDKILYPTLRRFIQGEAKQLKEARKAIDKLKARLGPMLPKSLDLDSLTAKQFEDVLRKAADELGLETSSKLAVRVSEVEIKSLRNNIFIREKEIKLVKQELAKMDSEIGRLQRKQSGLIEKMGKAKEAVKSETKLRRMREVHHRIAYTDQQLKELRQARKEKSLGYDVSHPNLRPLGRSREVALKADKAELARLKSDHKVLLKESKEEAKLAARETRAGIRPFRKSLNAKQRLAEKITEARIKLDAAEKSMQRALSHSSWETAGRFLAGYTRRMAAGEHNLRQAAAGIEARFGLDSASETRRGLLEEIRKPRMSYKQSLRTKHEILEAYNKEQRALGNQKPATEVGAPQVRAYYRSKDGGFPGDPTLGHVTKAEVKAREAAHYDAKALFSSLGLNVEERAALLWEHFRALTVSDVPVEEIRQFIDHGMVKMKHYMDIDEMKRFIVDPVHGKFPGRKTAGLTVEGEKFIKDLPDVWQSFKEGTSELDSWVVRSVEDSGGTALGRSLMNTYIPAEIGIATKTLLNESMSSGKTLEALFKYGKVAQAMDITNIMFKAVVTSGKADFSFGRRNWLDGWKGMIQTQTWVAFNPEFRQEVRNFFDGTGVLMTPDGAIHIDDLGRDLSDNLFAAFAARMDYDQEIVSQIARAVGDHKSTIAHSKRVGMEQISAGRMSGVALSKGAGIGAGVGAALGAVTGGPLLATVGASAGWGLGMATEAMIRGWTPGARGRMSTWMERMFPTGPAAAEAIENDFRAFYWASKVKGGAGVGEALDATNKLWRDWTNITPQERRFLRTMPFLFYNFMKQNTIAQLARLADSPWYGPMWGRTLRALGDELPEEHKQQWMHGLNSFSRGGRAYFMSDEFAAPFEFLEPIWQLGHGEVGAAGKALGRSAPPSMRAAMELIGGTETPFRFYGAIAKEYYEGWGGEMGILGINVIKDYASKAGIVKKEKDKMGNYVLEVSPYAAVFLGATGMETAIRVAQRPIQHLHENNTFLALWEWLGGNKSYLKSRPVDEFFRGQYDLERKIIDTLSDAGITYDNGIFGRSMAPDERQAAFIDRFLTGLNGKYYRQLLTKLRKASRDARAESNKPGAAEFN